MLKYIASFFYKSEPFSLEEAYNIINEDDTTETDQITDPLAETEEETSPAESALGPYETCIKIGKITEILPNNQFKVNDTHVFDCDLKLNVGSTISYNVINTEGELKVVNVILVENDWDVLQTAEMSTWHMRTIVSQVASREGRVFVLSPGDIRVNLNQVSSQFVPIVGDWVELDAKCEVDENVVDLNGRILEINRIGPVRPQIKTGQITFWSAAAGSGVISKNVHFDRDSLYSGYIPVVGDKVVAEVIESNQANCTWRALKIVPNFLSRNGKIVLGKLQLDEEFENDHDGLSITDDINLTFTKLGESKHFIILLEATVEFKLISVEIPRTGGQISPVTEIDHFDLQPERPLSIRLECKARSIGTSQEMVIFHFDSFKVRRWINIVVVADKREMRNSTYNRKYKEVQIWDKREVVMGRKPKMSSRFQSFQLPEYPLPSRIFNLVVKHNLPNDINELKQEVEKMKPSLNAQINYMNYEDKFHTLLHLDEAHCMLEMKTYDQERACFIKGGEFLMLEIENLAEKRPSVILGDRVFARSILSESGPDYQGFVHKTGKNHIYLKFSQCFHDSYDGEDYSIKIEASRTTYKREHHAIHLAFINLGKEWLFPTKMLEQAPQVNFTYDPYKDTFSNNLTIDLANDSVNNSSCNLITNSTSDLITNSTSNLITNSTSDLITNTTSNLITNSTSDLITNTTTNLIANSTSDSITNPTSDLTCSTTNLTTKSVLNSPRDKAVLLEKLKKFNAKNQKEVSIPKLEWYNPSLNFYQKEAVRNALQGVCRPLPYLIFGPPGTGKTVTVVEIILQILRMMPHSRLLIAAPSNSAADLLALRLIESKVLKPGDLIRLISMTAVPNIPTRLAPYCATANCERLGTESNQPVVTPNGLVLGYNSSVIGRHRITVSTCSNSAVLLSMGFSRGHFSHVIVDEAGQTSEPSVLIPMSFIDPSSCQAIMAGDPMQLGPVILSHLAGNYGLEESFLERLINRFPYMRDVVGFPNSCGYDPRLITKLIYNYRSLPDILKVPSVLFYNDDLRPTISDTDSDEARFLQRLQEAVPTLKNGKAASLVFHSVKGENFQTEDSPSWYNPNEAAQVFFYVNEFYRLGVKHDQIGIISPYKAQAKQLLDLFKEADFDVPKVGTIEEFQGQECPIIILSTVRSSKVHINSDLKYSLGFISSPRRLNVSLTRAKSLMLVIGNGKLLYIDRCWRKVIDSCIEMGSYVGHPLKEKDLKNDTKY